MTALTDTHSPDALLRYALLTEEGRKDTYAPLEALHTQGSAARVSLGFVAVCGYDAVETGVAGCRRSGSRTPTTSSPPRTCRLDEDQVAALKAASGTNLGRPGWSSRILRTTPGYGGLVSRAFTPRRMEAMRDSISAEVDRLLDEMDPIAPADIVTGLTAPLPQHAIGEILGLSPDDAESFFRHARVQSQLKDPASTFADTDRRHCATAAAGPTRSAS